MSVPISQLIPPATFSPWCPQVCSPHLCLYFCFAKDVIYATFLDPTYALINNVCFPLLDILNSEWQALYYSHLYKWHNPIHFYDWVVFHCIYVLHIFCPFICWWSSTLFPCPPDVNNTVVSAVVNIGLRVCFWIMVFSGCMLSGISGSYSTSILVFLRNLHTLLHSGFINLHSHQQCKTVPFSPQKIIQLQHCWKPKPQQYCDTFR